MLFMERKLLINLTIACLVLIFSMYCIFKITTVVFKCVCTIVWILKVRNFPKKKKKKRNSMIKSETNRVEADESWKYYSLKPE